MVQQLLLAGQLIVVLLVYVFVWRVLATARGDLLGGRGPALRGGAAAPPMSAQESTIIPAADVTRARREAGLGDPRLVVEASDVLRAGIPFVIGRGLTIGRATTNDIVLEEGVVSGTHLRVVPPDVVVDEGSTNGTLLNGERLSGRARIGSGDRVQVGSTVFRYEVER